MLPLIERMYWWSAKHLYGVRRVNGLDFVYVEADGERSAEQLGVLLKEAVALISAAKGGFGELVQSHMKFVAAIKVSSPYASHNVRAYISPFRGHEARNSQYLACQLVWAATFIRLSRDTLASGQPLNKSLIRQASYEAQLRFLRQLPDSEEWVEYLERNKPSFNADIRKASD